MNRMVERCGVMCVAILVCMSCLLTVSAPCSKGQGHPVPRSPEAIKAELRENGKLEKQFRQQQSLRSGNDVYMRGDNIVIYKSEVDLIAGRWAVSGYKDAEERAAQYLLKREALYHEALRQGYSATDEEAQEIVDSELETGKMSTNYDEFQAFLEEAELTDEAYWQAQHGLFKKELIISRYTEPIREAYAEEKVYSPRTMRPGKAGTSICKKSRTSSSSRTMSKKWRLKTIKRITKRAVPAGTALCYTNGYMMRLIYLALYAS